MSGPSEVQGVSGQIVCDDLYLSPHLDDAALSCGGRIFDQSASGRRVVILTFFTANPAGELSDLARDLHQRWNLDAESVMTARRREDEAACAVLGASWRHDDRLDALYRGGQDPRYPTLEALFGPLAEDDAPLLEILSESLGRVRAERVLAPLAVGNHVDHQLIRRAAERAFGERLEYYEDYPYARSGRALQRVLGRRRGWRPSVWPLGQAALEHKIRSISCFASQLGTAFRDEADMRRQVARFARRRGGERYWRRV